MAASSNVEGGGGTRKETDERLNVAGRCPWAECGKPDDKHSMWEQQDHKRFSEYDGHAPSDCDGCDGSGFVVVWDTEDLMDEDNCYCLCHRREA